MAAVAPELFASSRGIECGRRVAFDPVEHKYTLNGRELSSVTTVLKQMGMYPYYPHGNIYRDRGTAVHTACEWLDRNELYVEKENGQYVFPGTAPMLWGYIRAYMRFKDDFQFEPILIEQIVASEHLGVSGIFDRVGWMTYKGERVLGMVDLKSGSAPACVAIQLAGYCDLLGDRDLKRFSLELNAEDWQQPVEHKDPNDYPIWTSALNCFNWRKSKKLLDK